MLCCVMCDVRKTHFTTQSEFSISITERHDVDGFPWFSTSRAEITERDTNGFPFFFHRNTHTRMHNTIGMGWLYLEYIQRAPSRTNEQMKSRTTRAPKSPPVDMSHSSNGTTSQRTAYTRRSSSPSFSIYKTNNLNSFNSSTHAFWFFPSLHIDCIQFSDSNCRAKKRKKKHFLFVTNGQTSTDLASAERFSIPSHTHSCSKMNDGISFRGKRSSLTAHLKFVSNTFRMLSTRSGVHKAQEIVSDCSSAGHKRNKI